MDPKVVESEQSKYGSSANATRNLNRRVQEDNDSETIGGRHVSRPRQSSIYPYASANSTNRIRSYNRRRDICTLSDEYVDCLSARINRIEELIKSLTPANSENQKKPFLVPSTILGSETVDFSKVDIDELVSLSKQLGTKLFGDRKNQSANEETILKANNCMDIRAIINNKDN